MGSGTWGGVVHVVGALVHGPPSRPWLCVCIAPCALRPWYVPDVPSPVIPSPCTICPSAPTPRALRPQAHSRCLGTRALDRWAYSTCFFLLLSSPSNSCSCGKQCIAWQAAVSVPPDMPLGWVATPVTTPRICQVGQLRTLQKPHRLVATFPPLPLAPLRSTSACHKTLREHCKTRCAFQPQMLDGTYAFNDGG